MEGLDAVVVGGGLAGLAAAYRLAKDGLAVILFERGDHPGSKSMTGGRLYLEPVRPYLPELWEEAPLERMVTKERITAMAEGASVTFEFTSEGLRRPQPHSWTVLRSPFDRWFGEKVAEVGGFVIPQRKVTDLLKEDGRVVGVVAEGEEIPAQVVILADGVLSPLGEKAGLRGPLDPRYAAVGFKEVIRLEQGEIEKRFGLREGEGLAHLFFGSITKGVFGGGFLYTNRESLSLGLVVGIEAFTERLPAEMPELLEDFKARPEVAPLIEGGELLEYSAHLIPEGAHRMVKRLYGDGVLLAGDAAGFALNHGITVRGMDFALASGALAAQAVKEAKERGDFSSGSLARYEELLKGSFVLKDMEAFGHTSEVLAHGRLYDHYPYFLCSVAEELFRVGAGPKEKISRTLWRFAKDLLLDSKTWKDLWRMREL